MELPTSLHETLRPLMLSSTRSEPVVGTVFSGVMQTKFKLHSAIIISKNQTSVRKLSTRTAAL